MNAYGYVDQLQILYAHNDLKTAKLLIELCIESFPVEEDSITLIIIDFLPEGIFKYKLLVYYYTRITSILFEKIDNT